MSLLARALLVLLASAPVAALGQSQCQIGQTIVDQQGHCCWPGQGWAPDRQTCVGEPSCPTGMRSESGTCVAGAQPRTPVLPLPEQLPPPIRIPSVMSTLPVEFVSAEPGAVYEVSIDNKYAHTCRTPCHVLLTPGMHRVWVRGAADFGEKIWVGPAAGVVTIERRKSGFLTLGIVSVAVGGALAFGGGLAALMGQSAMDSYYSPSASGEPMRNIGLGLAIGGAALAVVGGIIGFSNKGHEGMKMVADPSTTLEAISVMPLPGGVMAGARFSF
jgi:hypothetical protein